MSFLIDWTKNFAASFKDILTIAISVRSFILFVNVMFPFCKSLADIFALR